MITLTAGITLWSLLFSWNLIFPIPYFWYPLSCLEEYDITKARLPSKEDLDVIDTVIYNDVASREALKAEKEMMRATVPTFVPSGFLLAG